MRIYSNCYNFVSRRAVLIITNFIRAILVGMYMSRGTRDHIP